MLADALGALDPPFAAVDLDAFDANAGALARRAAGLPIRVASKSVRCRALLERVLARRGFAGVMSFTLPETLWLHGHGIADLLLAYPSTDRAALRALGRIEDESAPIVMVDCADHLDLIDAAAGSDRAPIRVCIEFDLNLELGGGRVRIGPKRSPIREPWQAAVLAREIVRRPGFTLAGLMGYEGHVAGVGDAPPNPARRAAVRALRRPSVEQVAERRAAVVAAVRAVFPGPLLVNGGGTGSLETTATEAAVTEVAAGSGLYGPGLFDHYTAFTPRPAAVFGLPVVRRPDPDTVTLLGGGYPASGAAGRDRLPTPHHPPGLALTLLEGAGEVQTPVTGSGQRELRIGDTVLMRHAKAGELCERFSSLYLVAGGAVVDEVPTYRGEGKAFL